MSFTIADTRTTEDRFSRTWTGRVRMTDQTGEAPVEVIFHAPGDKITITALGGIAFADIPFEVQDYAKLIAGTLTVSFPEWDAVREIATQCLYDLARRPTFRAVAEPLGWPLPANPNPRVRATITMVDGPTVLQDTLLSDLAETLQDPNVRAVTLTRLPPAGSGREVRAAIQGIPEPGLRVGYAQAYLDHNGAKDNPDHHLTRRRGVLRRVTYYNGDLKIVSPTHPAANAIAEVTWDDSTGGTSGIRVAHLAQILDEPAVG